MVRPVRDENSVNLYWWRPSGNRINLGDEISPLIFRHVFHRDAIWADVNACDAIGVGSIFYPRKASRRKRKRPLFIWGSGTLECRTCEYSDLSIVIGALRGPRTAGAIRGCPEIPLGDPGLFVGEIFKKAEGGGDGIGIIPHHSVRKHPDVKRLAESVGARASILDFTDPDIKKTLDTLSRCNFVISSSLHGLIFSDSYGVPSLFWNDFGVDNEWKFRDYFEGVAREEFASLNTSQLVAALAEGGVQNLPFSCLSTMKLSRTLAGLREAALKIKELD